MGSSAIKKYSPELRSKYDQLTAQLKGTPPFALQLWPNLPFIAPQSLLSLFP